jgi:hypothetical protein
MELKTKVRQAEEGIVVTCLGWMRLISCWLLGASAMPLTAQRRNAVEEPGQLKVIQVREPDGQILSYGDLSRPTEVWMGGTSLAREAGIKLKIQGASGSSPLLPFIRKRRPGFVEIDIEPRRNHFGEPTTHQHQREDALPSFLAYGDSGTRLRRGRSEPAGGSL